MDSVLEALPDPALTLVGDRVQGANAAAAALLGGDPRGMAVAELRGGVRNLVGVGTWRRLDGGTIELEVSAGPWGEGQLLLLRDLTRRAIAMTVLRDDRNRLHAVLDALPTAAFVVSPARKVLFVNPAGERSAGMPSAVLLGDLEVLMNRVDAPDREWLANSLSRAFEGEAVAGDLHISGRAHEAQVEPLGGKHGVVLLARPIARERELVGAVRQSARRELDQWSLMAASLAKDLAERLTVLAASLDTLGPGSAPEAAQAAERSLVESRLLLGDLVQLSQTMGGSERTALRISQALTDAEQRARSKAPPGVEVRLEDELGEAEVVAEVGPMRRVLDQCVRAAFPAAGVTGRLTLRGMREGGRVVLEVVGEGARLPRDTFDHLFKPFPTQGASLAAARAQVQAWEGDISAELGEASLTLRVALPSLSRHHFDTEEPEALPRSILLVDDDDDVRRSLDWVLRSRGLHVHGAASGQQALDWLARNPAPELVLLDLNMPGLGGEDVLAQLRQTYPSVRVLMMSGFAREATIRSCLRAGALGFVNKPFRVQDIQRALAEGRRRHP